MFYILMLTLGIAVTKLLSINVVLRELDLSFSSITTDGAMNILDALIESHSLKVQQAPSCFVAHSTIFSDDILHICYAVLDTVSAGKSAG